MSVSQWFLLCDGERRGPYEFAQVVSELLKLPDPDVALVWQKGLQGWVRPSLVPAIAAELPPPHAQFLGSTARNDAPAHTPRQMAHDDAPPRVELANGGAVVCPLCRRAEKLTRKLYAHDVCRECWASFANRRQLAFVVDWLLISVASFILGFAVGHRMSDQALQGLAFLLFAPLLLLKDGFRGRSPGKALMDLTVVDVVSGAPAGLGASLLRNLPLLVPFVPLFVAFQLKGGRRVGDGWAGTRVIWNRYSRSEVFASVPAVRVAPLTHSPQASRTLPSRQPQATGNNNQPKTGKLEWIMLFGVLAVFVGALMFLHWEGQRNRVQSPAVLSAAPETVAPPSSRQDAATTAAFHATSTTTTTTPPRPVWLPDSSAAHVKVHEAFEIVGDTLSIRVENHSLWTITGVRLSSGSSQFDFLSQEPLPPHYEASFLCRAPCGLRKTSKAKVVGVFGQP